MTPAIPPGATAAAASFRCYAELNDPLPPECRQVDFPVPVHPPLRLGEALAALGIPAQAVDLALVNGRPADFACEVRPGDRVAVYPVFEALDVGPVTRLPGRPLRAPRFVLDVHLGRLARLLRMLGFDTRCGDAVDDDALVRSAETERRILLTRDRALARRPGLARAHWLAPRKPAEQIVAVLTRFDLLRHIRPFTRCLVCNGAVAAVPKAQVAGRLLPGTARDHEAFRACQACGRVYWEGSHHRHMAALVGQIRAEVAARLEER